jgi:hypothetical protein
MRYQESDANPKRKKYFRTFGWKALSENIYGQIERKF